jgi:hypothetical protein
MWPRRRCSNDGCLERAVILTKVGTQSQQSRAYYFRQDDGRAGPNAFSGSPTALDLVDEHHAWHRQRLAGRRKTPVGFDPEYGQRARSLVADHDAALCFED